MNGGVTYKDMEDRKAASAECESLRAQLADTLQANRVSRDLLAQMEARAVAAEARAKALEEALCDLRTAARNGRGLISRMRDYVPVRSDFWEVYNSSQIAEMLAALEMADERAASALKEEA